MLAIHPTTKVVGLLAQKHLVNVSSPIQVGSLTNWVKVCASNDFTYAINSNGELWSWGLNNNGELGLGDTVRRSSPVQVGANTTWSVIPKNSSEGQHMIALRS